MAGNDTQKPDAEARVAFDLMQLISGNESSEKTKDREYWLTLYCQCRKATSGMHLKAVLENK